MQLSKPYQYVISVVSGGGYSVRGQNGEYTFLAPVTHRGPKLYTFSSDSCLLYVGQTVQGMAARVRLGFQADGSSGYYGYGWRQALSKVDLHIWCLDDTTEGEEALALECIESEVVYLCRSVYGQWPAHQTEIHFHESTNEHRQLAESIFSLFNRKRAQQGALGDASQASRP